MDTQPISILSGLLNSNHFNIWYTRLLEQVPATMQKDYLSNLNAAERQKYSCLSFEPYKSQYLQARTFVRLLLSTYCANEIRPHLWLFEQNPFGRPQLVENQMRQCPLHFNLSHTQGLMACIISHDYQVGVDVENTLKTMQWYQIANSAFSKNEIEKLNTKDSQSLRSKFYQYWTLKEAYIKARGMGLSLPTDEFSIIMGAPSPIQSQREQNFNLERVEMNPQIKILPTTSTQEMDPTLWRFELINPTQFHQAAIAVKLRADSGPIHFTQRWFNLSSRVREPLFENEVSDLAA